MSWTNLRAEIAVEMAAFSTVDLLTDHGALEWSEWHRERIRERLRENYQRNKVSRRTAARARVRRYDEELRQRRRLITERRLAASDALARSLGATPLPPDQRMGCP